MDSTTADERLLAPLFDGLGSYEHPITASSPLAQRYFNQGLTLVYAFNHAEAIRSFEAAAALSPGSAMPYWGVALALGPNINAPMSDEAAVKARAALDRAVALAPQASDEERAYVNALSARYAADPTQDRGPLDRAYADAMRDLAARFPDDIDAATLYAEALMVTTPWDYWTPERALKPELSPAAAALSRVLERRPDHPGANHFRIHLMEAGPEPQTALPSADRLRTLVPASGHLVHMSSHIYVRLGLYGEATFANEIALLADEKYLADTRAQGFYPAMYYPHNVHFLWYAMSLEGRSEEALIAARRAVQLAHHGATEADRFLPLPHLILLRFGRMDAILGEAPPPRLTPFVEAIVHFCRGSALAAKGDREGALGEHSELHALLGSAELMAQDSPNLPASALVALADKALSADIALLEGQRAEGIAALQEAVQMEDALPYMEPPFWSLPMRHRLGAALLEGNEPEQAEAVYRRDLEIQPNNGFSLFGLSQSLRAQGKDAQAGEVDARFRASWVRGDVVLTSSRF